jgi:hypothetical protein
MDSLDAVIIPVTILKYETYSDAMLHLNDQGVTHLGWLNSGISIPKWYTFQKVYSNWSGSSCLYCDPIYRVSYSVDMGD